MRLSAQQVKVIKEAVASMIGASARVWLFGSRVDDAKRGGDIDLLIEVDTLVPNRVVQLCRLEALLIRQFGERKLDVLLKDPGTPEAAIHRIALRTGVQL